jgi:hypothetical protein
MALSKWGLQVKDYSDESSTMEFPIPLLSAINWVATMGLIDDLRDALVLVNYFIKGLRAWEYIIARIRTSAGAAMTPQAQREAKWLVRYHDTTTGKKGIVEIPTADFSLLSANSDYMNVAPASAGAAFVTAFEAFVLSEAGNAVAFDFAKLVGRSL